MRLLGVLLGVVVFVVALAAGSASHGGKPGNSGNARSCQKNGWMDLFTRSGQPFSSAGGVYLVSGPGRAVDRQGRASVPQRRLERARVDTG